MNVTVDTREFSIVVVAKSHNPAILNPDFLKDNEIVPANWELEKPPVCLEPVAEIVFKNKVRIIAQLDKLIFSENVKAKSKKSFVIPVVAKKYSNILPHVEYRAVGINQKGHVAFGDDKNAPRKFILERLVVPGPWCEFGNGSVRPSITFNYTLENATCGLTIQEKSLKNEEGNQISVLLFSSNFHHELEGETRKERLVNLQQIISEWESDFNSYEHLVNDIFLGAGDKNGNKPR